MADVFTLSGTLVDLIGTNIVKSLGFLAAVGSLSMALVQVLKDVGPFRQWFNDGFLWNWYVERLSTSPPHKRRNFGWARRKTDQDVQAALDQTVLLAAGGHKLALLDLTVEQLCGQLNSAAQVALEYPQLYPSFFQVIVAGALKQDVEVVARGNPNSVDFGTNANGEKRYITPNEQDKQRYLEARARIGQFAQRSIDALHIRLGARWKWWMQLASFAFSAVITYAAFAIYHGNWRFWELGANDIFYLVFGCILGGFLAPIARDIVAAVQSRQ